MGKKVILKKLSEQNRTEKEIDRVACRVFYGEMGKQVKSLRCDMNLSQAEFAFMTGLSDVSISNLENGKTKASAYTVHKIAQGVGVPITEILYGPLKFRKQVLEEMFYKVNQLPLDYQQLVIDLIEVVLKKYATDTEVKIKKK